jgi:hypothetical protein
MVARIIIFRPTLVSVTHSARTGPSARGVPPAHRVDTVGLVVAIAVVLRKTVFKD